MKNQNLHNWRSAILVAALAGGVALSGCSRDDSVVSPLDENAFLSGSGEVDEGGLALGGARLNLTTSDPAQTYVRGNKDPWFRRSTVTHAEVFDLIVVNSGRRTAVDLEVLVTVPEDIDQLGWSVNVDGQVFSSLAEFPEDDLRSSYYPRVPHGVYQPRGNGVFLRFAGPESLAPGESWTIPIQVSRGSVEGFKVHFVAASSNRMWTSPLADVTAQPPMSSGGGGERIAR